MTQLFCDMDGVLADFDSGYRTLIGPYGGKEQDDVDWKAVKAVPNFFEKLPPMPDFENLWSVINELDPIILTGVPTHAPEEALENKKAWVRRHIGDDVKLIGCKSKDKCLHGKPGDVLIDDWEKYKHKWIEMGGHWITHTDATNTIELLREHFIFMKRWLPWNG